MVRLRTFRRFIVILGARRPQRKVESEKPDKYLNLVREIRKYVDSLCVGHYQRVWKQPRKDLERDCNKIENPRKNENHPEDCIPEDSVNNEGIVRELWKLAATWSPMEVTKIRLVWKVNTYKMIESFMKIIRRNVLNVFLFLFLDEETNEQKLFLPN